MGTVHASADCQKPGMWIMVLDTPQHQGILQSFSLAGCILKDVGRLRLQDRQILQLKANLALSHEESHKKDTIIEELERALGHTQRALEKSEAFVTELHKQQNKKRRRRWGLSTTAVVVVGAALVAVGVTR